MCKAFNISRSSYYKWRKRPISNRQKSNNKLLEKIRDIHIKSKGIYGSPRITAELVKQNYQCSKNRVAKLMRINNLKSKIKKKFKRTTNSSHKLQISSNILKGKVPNEINRSWVGDITYIFTKEGWLYLSVIMDLYNLEIIGWSMKENLGNSLALESLDMAIRKRKPKSGVTFHSDRGIQYSSNEFRMILKSRGFIQSMSRKGNCYDNSFCESFFHSLKTEELYFHDFDTKKEAESVIFEYIEVFYNRRRIHSSLNYLTPIEFSRSSA